MRGDFTTTCLTSSASGLFSNTYVIDAPDGIVVVDPPMLLSDAQAVRQHVEELHRPLAAIVYTHPHPDHVNGGTLVRGSSAVPVYATRETDRVSREIDGPKREYWTATFGEDYPPVTTFATELVAGGATCVIAGLPFYVLEVGAGECEAGSLWISGADAFVGDLVYADVHPWLFEGRSREWLAQLEDFRSILDGRTLHVGHGRPGGSELLDEQAAYLRAYQDAVRDLARGGDTLDEQATAELVARMVRLRPTAPLVDLVAMSADAVAAELARAG